MERERGIDKNLGGWRRYAHLAVIGLIAFVVASTAFYAFAFETIYARPHPAVQASRWINEFIPKGANIVFDNHWDEGIPKLYSYKVEQIPIYETDTLEKMQSMARLLAQGDYLVFYSNRTYGSVARAAELFPLSSRYYHLLFSEGLGYKLEKAFNSYPSLLGVAFMDDPFTRARVAKPELLKAASPALLSFNLGYADNDVITYDHPQVLIFKNVERLAQSKIYQRLTVQSSREERRPELGLMLTHEEKRVQREGGTWSGIIKRDSWTNKVPIVAWLLLVELIYFVTLPLAFFLFNPLPDRGIVLGRLLGILGVSYAAWLLSSLHWISFSRALVLVGIILMASLSSLVLVVKGREFVGFIKQRWRMFLVCEALFVGAFLAFVVVRTANPDLWHPWRGGEKPMDLAYLNAVLRSTYMPPYDPWFAGGYLNYYYWGQFIIATLIKATGILPAAAYNLAISLLFALTVTGAYSVVYNLAEGVRRKNEGQRGAGGPILAGLLASVFAAVIGNLDGLVQLLQGAWNSLVKGGNFPSFDFWRSSRMLPDQENITPSPLTFWLSSNNPNALDISPHITEFPFFSFLFADLHAHLIIIPFTLLALGLIFSLMVGLITGRNGWLIPVTLSLAAVIGSLWTINSWDYPTYIGLSIVSIAVGIHMRKGSGLARLRLFLILGSSVVLVSLLTFLPFHFRYEAFNNTLEVSKWRTPIANYLAIHGLFIFVAVTFLVYLAWEPIKEVISSLTYRTMSFWEAPVSTFRGIRALLWAVLGWLIFLLAVVYMAAAGYWNAVFLSAMLALNALVFSRVLINKAEDAPYILFPLIMLDVALLIGVGMDFVRVEGDIGRMNTLFKYYLEAWVLFSLVSAYALWYLAFKGFFSLRRVSLPKAIWLGFLGLLLFASFVYPVLGTRARLADRFNTDFISLDGSTYMKKAVHNEEGRNIELKWDYEAIKWLQDNVQGSPVILEAQMVQYHWASRIASYTGLPTILGWPWHQIQQRMKYDYAIKGREAVVREIYSTSNKKRALELLQQYEVEYIVVAELERALYTHEGIQKFEEMATDGLMKLEYQNPEVKIYRRMW